MTELQTTPSQTVGPFFENGLFWEDGPFVVPDGTEGAFRVEGRVLDGAGEPVPDAVVETWQADPEGRFDHPDDPRGPVRWKDFRGFGRAATDAGGRWGLLTVKPGPLPAGDGWEAPHLNVSVFCRGMLVRLVTRIYFPDEEANAQDPVLGSIADPAARSTLIATTTPSGYHFDIRLQGEHETVFFDV
ncbi:protocatechuate 3,4-dioxygenase subunit alpha [Actinosynnema sp. NPDC047251]|uniref:Protocatechuate 3,4-dioxygenase, alpha chain n=1 Tax=Saccharothrix espanaensis (strain ATCC 51144 / DSM 44229 / JCM 9112 / NBRC 15066 / NRRL 15764) TaxID=1179773 RepID=K0K9R6_SACES|nr:protocatechuate 3,4-dioxygenase subunit alpha [Saccharothrix espanaensis]CCH33373.1 Protocatechuate 3,4-dioxygenase, alpha chain [Saccharothrix espanaensis DSM 44229]